MKYSEALWVSARCCFIGTLVGGYFGSLISSLLLRHEAHATLLEWLIAPLTALGVLLFAAGFAALPITLFAMPIYALMVQRGRASYLGTLSILAVFLAGLWPFTEPRVVAFVALLGVPIAFFTHQTYKVGSNKSFKPNLLRRSA